MRILQLTIGSIENYQDQNNCVSFADTVFTINPSLTCSDDQLLTKLKREPHTEVDSYIGKVVSKKVYTYCSRNQKPVTTVIQEASDYFGRKPNAIHDEELSRFVQV